MPAIGEEENPTEQDRFQLITMALERPTMTRASTKSQEAKSHGKVQMSTDGIQKCRWQNNIVTKWDGARKQRRKRKRSNF